MSERDRTWDDVATVTRIAAVLLPELVGWIRAMLRAGRSEDDMRRDISDRRAEMERHMERVEAEIEAKHRRGG